MGGVQPLSSCFPAPLTNTAPPSAAISGLLQEYQGLSQSFLEQAHLQVCPVGLETELL